MLQQPAELRVEVYDSFEAVPAADVAALDGCRDAGLFSGWFWYRNLYETALVKSDCVRLYLVRSARDPATPCLLVPMVHARSQARFALRTLRACSNFYTPLFSPLVNCDGEELGRCLQAWADTVTHERPRWDCISLAPLDPDHPLLSKMHGALRAAGPSVHDYFCFGNWHHRVTSIDYRDYLKNLPGRTRSTIARKRRALGRDPQFRIALCSTVEQVPEALSAYAQVFAASWKSPEPHPAFIPGLIDGAARRGCLRLGIAYFGAQPAACQLWLVQDGIASIFKLAYMEKFSALSVGTVLSDAMMRHAIECDRVVEIDFLSGDDVFKQEWMSERRERQGCVAYNRSTLAGRCADWREVAARWCRQLLKRQSTRTGSATGT